MWREVRSKMVERMRGRFGWGGWSVAFLFAGVKWVGIIYC